MAVVVALATRKGGAGKTSLAISLAAVSVSKSFHTGTVDLDSQANLSRWCLGRERVDQLGGLNSVAALSFPPAGLLLDDFAPLQHVKTREQLVETVVPHCVFPVDYVPGLSCVPTAHHIHAETAKELVLSRLPFDLVFVDTPPDISSYAVRSVLGQADMVISPVVCEPWAVDSIEALTREIRSVGRGDLLDEARIRFVVNMRQKTALHDKLERVIRQTWGRLISNVVIPRSVAIAEASIDARILTKKHALWKVGVSLMKELESMSKKRGAA